MTKIDVLDKGYVRLRDKMGDDLKPADVARVSFDRRAEEFTDEQNQRLMNYLFRNKEYSCFRHNVMSFEIYMPLMVARQIYKYSIASSFREDQNGWNESCLPIDQEVTLWDGKRVTLEEVFKNKNEYALRSVNDDNIIVPNTVKDFWSTGIAKVYEIRDDLGNSVMLTENHRVSTPNGYVPVSDLSVGDKINHNGKPLWQDEAWLTEQYQVQDKYLKDVADLAGCSTHTIRKWAKIFGIQKEQTYSMQKYNRENGVFGKGETALTNPKIAERGVKSSQWWKDKSDVFPKGEASHAYKGGNVVGERSTYHYRARRIAEQQGWATCKYCDTRMEEIHHIDEDYTNNEVENLMPLCCKHHYMIHGKSPLVVGESTIVSKEHVKTVECFDVEMTHESNFVAGGIVVHNSRRYITEEPEFYIPEHSKWRTAPENKKQGSGSPLPDNQGQQFTELLMGHIDRSVRLYDAAIDNGIAVEQARVFLPAYGMYVRAYWTASLNAIFHFLDERLAGNAQSEIREYAEAVEEIVKKEFPIIYSAWKNNK